MFLHQRITGFILGFWNVFFFFWGAFVLLWGEQAHHMHILYIYISSPEHRLGKEENFQTSHHSPNRSPWIVELDNNGTESAQVTREWDLSHRPYPRSMFWASDLKVLRGFVPKQQDTLVVDSQDPKTSHDPKVMPEHAQAPENPPSRKWQPTVPQKALALLLVEAGVTSRLGCLRVDKKWALYVWPDLSLGWPGWAEFGPC